MPIRSCILVGLLLLPTFALAAPRSAPGKKPLPQQFYVDSSAQVVLNRAAKLYGTTPQWSGQIVESATDSEGMTKISVAYIRPNFIRIENREGKDTLFEMADGKTVSSYVQSPDLGNHSTRKVQLRTLSEILGGSIASPKATGQYLAALLQWKSIMPTSTAEFKAQNLRSLRIKSLSAATWKSQKCERILIEKHYKTKTGEDAQGEKELSRDELWFTREGKLVKALVTENRVGEGPETWKGEVLAQNFTPNFKPSIFRFTPPKEKLPYM